MLSIKKDAFQKKLRECPVNQSLSEKIMGEQDFQHEAKIVYFVIIAQYSNNYSTFYSQLLYE